LVQHKSFKFFLSEGLISCKVLTHMWKFQNSSSHTQAHLQHLLPIWNWYGNPTSSNVVKLVIDLWEMVFKVHCTYLSKFKWVLDWWHLFMKVKIGLHALGRTLQHSSKEVKKTFVVFEASQVDVKLLHYKVLWTLMCITLLYFSNQVMLKHYFNSQFARGKCVFYYWKNYTCVLE